jgi:hypothetical protein
MRRLQLHITEAQDRRLSALARRLGTSRAELIRRGIERVLADTTGGSQWLDLIGQAGPARRADGSEQHDRLLVSHKLLRPR